MMGLPNDVNALGVYVPRGLLKVTLPLLLTYRPLYVLLKKSMGNGRSTRPVEPSSLAGRVFVLKPARMALRGHVRGTCPEHEGEAQEQKQDG